MSALISKDALVTIHYDLSDADGNLLHSSRPDEPLTYQQGAGQVVPGLEAALEGHQAGERLKVEIEAEQAYGLYDPEKVFLVERSMFPQGRLEIGQTLELTPDEGTAYMGTIVAVNKREVEVDSNHPLAGEDVVFDVEVLNVQERNP